MKKLYFLLLAIIITTSVNSQLAITEYIANPFGLDSDKEWIELYNYSDNPVNLKGWEIKGGSSYIIDITNTDFFVQPGGYVILASDKATFESEWLSGVTNSNVIDYDYSNFFIVNTTGNFRLGYDDDFGFLEMWYIKFNDDEIEGRTTFAKENSTIYRDHMLWKIDRFGLDSVQSPTSSYTYVTGYENTGHTQPITSTNGDTGTPLFGGYVSETPLAGSCLNPYQIACGQTFSGDNSNGENNIFNYDCASQNEYGFETFHEFTITQNSDVVISITNLTADLDVHLLNANSCDGSGCIARHDNSITQNGLAAGTYFVAVDGYGTNFSTLSGYDLLVTCSANPTNLDEINVADDIKVYPNPSAGFINISSEKNTITNITVRDMSGRIIIANQKDNFNNIDLNNASNGFYFIDIKTNNGRATKKISILK